MHLKDLKKLFPLEGQLTNEILNSAVPLDNRNCRGVLTLKAALGEVSKELGFVTWGTYNGSISLAGNILYVTTRENTNFVASKKPGKMTFILKAFILKED
jgi:hypothetical protein